MATLFQSKLITFKSGCKYLWLRTLPVKGTVVLGHKKRKSLSTINQNTKHITVNESETHSENALWVDGKDC